MSIVKQRKWFLPISIFIITLVIWVVFIKFGDSSNYIIKYFYNPNFVYIPLTIFSAFAVLFLAYKITSKKMIGIFAVCCFILSFIYCFAIYSFMYTSVNSVEHQERYKNIQEICEPSNLVFPQRKFEKSNVITMLSDGLPYYAFGDAFLYSDEQQYIALDNTSVTVDVYYLKKLNPILLEMLLTNMKERYFFNKDVTEIKISPADVVKISTNDCKYSYCYETIVGRESSGRKYKSYFAAVIEKEDTLVMLSMKIWHNDKLEPQIMMQNLLSCI